MEEYKFKNKWNILKYLFFRVWVWSSVLVIIGGILYIPNHFLNKERIEIVSITPLKYADIITCGYSECEVIYRRDVFTERLNLSKLPKAKKDSIQVKDMIVLEFTETGDMRHPTSRNRIFGYYYGLEKVVSSNVMAILLGIAISLFSRFILYDWPASIFDSHRRYDQINAERVLGLDISDSYVNLIKIRLQWKDSLLHDWYVFEYNWIEFIRKFIPKKKSN